MTQVFHDVFINYRTHDAEETATTLELYLVDRFGRDRVFRDSRSIEAGTTFPEVLREGAHQCRIMIPVIGPRWLTAGATEGRRQPMARPSNWTRKELLIALERGIPIIPVLVGEARRLRAEDLPPALARLARYQDRRYHTKTATEDLGKIGDEVARILPYLNDNKVPPRDSADSPGAVTTTVNAPSGPVNTGTGHQYNSGQTFSGDGATFIGGSNSGGVRHRFGGTR